MTDILTTTLIEKVDAHSKKIEEIEETIKNNPDHTADILQMKKDMTQLKTNVQALGFPTGDMQELSFRLKEAVTLFKQPVTNKVLHHHHVPKVIFIAAGLFLVVCLLSLGWYMNA